MLVLSRTLNQGILIGDNIMVRVVKNQNGRVRLGIEAPRDVNVIREELAGVPRTQATSGESEGVSPRAEIELEIDLEAVAPPLTGVLDSPYREPIVDLRTLVSIGNVARRAVRQHKLAPLTGRERQRGAVRL